MTKIKYALAGSPLFRLESHNHTQRDTRAHPEHFGAVGLLGILCTKWQWRSKRFGLQGDPLEGGRLRTPSCGDVKPRKSPGAQDFCLIGFADSLGSVGSTTENANSLQDREVDKLDPSWGALAIEGEIDRGPASPSRPLQVLLYFLSALTTVADAKDQYPSTSQPQPSFGASPCWPPAGGPCWRRPNALFPGGRGACRPPSSAGQTVEPTSGRRLPWAAAPRAASSSAASSASGGGHVPRWRGRCIPPSVVAAAAVAPWRRAEHPRVRPGLLATSSRPQALAGYRRTFAKLFVPLTCSLASAWPPRTREHCFSGYSEAAPPWPAVQSQAVLTALAHRVSLAGTPEERARCLRLQPLGSLSSGSSSSPRSLFSPNLSLSTNSTTQRPSPDQWQRRVQARVPAPSAAASWTCTLQCIPESSHFTSPCPTSLPSPTCSH